MTGFRQHLLSRRRAAAWLVVLALALKLLMPTGYMIAMAAGGTVAIVPCSGYGPQAMPGTGRHAAPAAGAHGMAHGQPATPDHAATGHADGGDDHGAGGHGKAEMPCTFAGLSAPALAAADPLLLAAAILFILATAFRAADRPTAARAAAHLRPPPIGPPLHA